MQALKQLIKPALLQRMEQREALTHALRVVLPGEMACHCWAGRIEDNRFTVLVDNSSWALRLRYQQREILSHINQLYNLELNRMEIRLIDPPTVIPPTPAPPRPPKPGKEAAKALLLAARCVSDPELARTLERFGRRCEQNAREHADDKDKSDV